MSYNLGSKCREGGCAESNDAFPHFLLASAWSLPDEKFYRGAFCYSKVYMHICSQWWPGHTPEGVLVALPVPGSVRMPGSQLELFLDSALAPGAGACALFASWPLSLPLPSAFLPPFLSPSAHNMIFAVQVTLTAGCPSHRVSVSLTQHGHAGLLPEPYRGVQALPPSVDPLPCCSPCCPVPRDEFSSSHRARELHFTWSRCRRMLASFFGILLLALALPSVPGGRRCRRMLASFLGVLLLAIALPSGRMGRRLASLPPKRWRWRRSCRRLGLDSRAAAWLLPKWSSRWGGRRCLCLACPAAALLFPERRS